MAPMASHAVRLWRTQAPPSRCLLVSRLSSDFTLRLVSVMRMRWSFASSPSIVFPISVAILAQVRSHPRTPPVNTFGHHGREDGEDDGGGGGEAPPHPHHADEPQREVAGEGVLGPRRRRAREAAHGRWASAPSDEEAAPLRAQGAVR